jgi:hypothetical protein
MIDFFVWAPNRQVVLLTQRTPILGLWFDPAQGLRVSLASRFSHTHYLLILLRFLQSLKRNTNAKQIGPVRLLVTFARLPNSWTSLWSFLP